LLYKIYYVLLLVHILLYVSFICCLPFSFFGVVSLFMDMDDTPRIHFFSPSLSLSLSLFSFFPCFGVSLVGVQHSYYTWNEWVLHSVSFFLFSFLFFSTKQYQIIIFYQFVFTNHHTHNHSKGKLELSLYCSRKTLCVCVCVLFFFSLSLSLSLSLRLEWFKKTSLKETMISSM